ncbi:GntR family transcriptional regulator [bacterium]|nr:GntR family transcriptional regulator [bacterium]
MQIHVSDSNGTPFYQQVVSQIKLLAASGRLEPGEQLPPVRKLAEQLLINPNTVARAYRELEAEGVVTARRGAGVFIADGGSPLSRREKNKRLNDRIDGLLAEATQLGFDLDALLRLVEQRGRTFTSQQGE